MNVSGPRKGVRRAGILEVFGKKRSGRVWDYSTGGTSSAIHAGDDRVGKSCLAGGAGGSGELFDE